MIILLFALLFFDLADFNVLHARVKFECFTPFSAGTTGAQRCTRTCSKLPGETCRTSKPGLDAPDTPKRTCFFY